VDCGIGFAVEIVYPLPKPASEVSNVILELEPINKVGYVML
jgi:hypothetical protein